MEVNCILQGNALEVLKKLPDESVQAVITSPPYYGGLRDYQVPPTVWDGDERCQHEWGEPQRAPWANSVPGPNGRKKNTAAGHWKSKEAGQFCQQCGAWQGCLGQEPHPQMYVDHLVQIFREVRRVLRKDGTCFVNIGDSYQGSSKGAGGKRGKSSRYRLRENLTPQQEAYVLSELAAFRKVSKVGLPEVTAGIDETIAPLASSEKVGG